MATRTISDAGGNWDATAAWVGGVVPTSADVVVATGTSGNVTINVAASCRSINLTNYVGTLTHNSAITLSIGDGTAGASNVALKFVAGMTYTRGSTTTSAIAFVSTSGTQQTIDYGGKNVGNQSFSTAGNWLLSSAIIQDAATGSLNITAGTFNFGSFTSTIGTMSSSGSTARTITMNATYLNVKGYSGGYAWDFNAANLTFNCGTSTINFNTSSGGSFGVLGAGKTYYNVIFQITTAYSYLYGVNTFTNLTLSSTSYSADNGSQNVLHLAGNQTVTGTLTVTGTSSSQRACVKTTSVSGNRTVTAAATSLTHCDLQGITAAGAASPFVAAGGSVLGDAGRNVNCTFATPVTCYWVGGAGSLSDTSKWASISGGSGGTVRFPLPQDTMIFDASSGSGTVTIDTVRFGGLDMTGGTGINLTFNGMWGGMQCHGSFILNNTSTCTLVDGQSLLLWGQGTHTFNVFGKSLWTSANGSSGTGALVVQGGTYNVVNNFTLLGQGTSGGYISFGVGTLNLGSATVNARGFLSTSGLTRTFNGSTSTLNITGCESSNTWNTITTGLTFNASTVPVNFTGTTGTATISTGGLSMPPCTFNGVGGAWTFGDSFTTTGVVLFQAGTLNTNNQTCSFGQFGFHGTGVRTLTLGSSAITITAAAGGSGWRADTAGNLTITSNTATVTFTGSTGMINGTTLSHGGTSFVFDQNTTMVIYNGGFSGHNITVTGPANKTALLQLQITSTLNCNSLTVDGNSTTNRIFMRSDRPGAVRTVNPTSFSFSNVDFQDITASGTAWTGTSLGNAGGNTNITFPAAVTRYGVVAGNWSATATWSTGSGGLGGASVPLPHDGVVLDANSAAGTYTADMPRMGLNLTCTGFTRTLSFASTANILFGNVTLGSGMILAGTQATTLSSRSASTITSNGKTFPQTIVLSDPTNTRTLQDAFVTLGTLQQDYGTFDANNFAVTALQFSSNNANTRTVTMGTGVWTLTGAVAGVWTTSTSTNLTLTATTSSLVKFTATSGTGTIATGGVSMPPVEFNGVGGTWQLADNYATMTTGTVSVVILTAGTLDLNDKNLTLGGVFYSNAGTAVRSLLMKSGTVTIAGAGGTVWNVGSPAGNLTINAGTSLLTATIGWVSFWSSGHTYYNVVINSSSNGQGPWGFSGGSNTFNNLTLTSTAVKSGWVGFGADAVVNGTFTATGDSSSNRLLVSSGMSTPGVQRTISAAAVSFSNVDFQDISASGAATPWTGTSIGDALGNTSITFTPATTRYAVLPGNWSSTATWSTSSGGPGGASVPLPHDDVVFDTNSNTGAGGSSYSADMPRMGKNVTSTGTITRAINLNGQEYGVYVFGNFVLDPSHGVSGTGGYRMVLSGRGAHTHASTSYPSAVYVTGPGGTYTLTRNLVVGGSFYVTAGSFDSAGYTLTLPYSLHSPGTLTRVITLGSSVLNFTGAGASNAISFNATGLTVSAASSTCNITSGSTLAFLLDNAGHALGNINFTAPTGSTLTAAAASTLTSLNASGAGQTILFPASATMTIGSLAIAGTPAGRTALASSSTGVAATVSRSAGLTSFRDVTIKDLTFTGGAVWQARDATNISGNTGLTFVLDGAWGISA